MFGAQVYREGQFPPERGGEHDWHVRCATGALEVLRGKEHERKIAGTAGYKFTINFGNGSSARIRPGHPL